MLCIPGEAISELDFVLRVSARRPGECIGPVVKLSIPAPYLDVLEEALSGGERWSYLVACYLDEGEHLVFGMCVLHWLEMSSMLWANGIREGVPDWRQISQALLQTTCTGAELDPKEISNFFVWQGLTLPE